MAEEKKTTVESAEDVVEVSAATVESSKDSFASAVDTKALADQLGVDESLIIDDMNMTALEKEQNPYTKSDLSDEETVMTDENGDRIDDLKEGESVDISDGKLTANENGTVHCESEYLGEFDYNPDEFAYGYKEIIEKDGTTSQLPVLTYVGEHDGAKNFIVWDTRMSNITIPDGIKSCDYMFANNETLKYAPRMPDSVESAHYMYANCTNLDGHTREAKDGESWLDNSGGSVHLSENLKDMSGMYKDCANMESDFGELPASVVNIKDAWEGCEGTGSKEDGFLFFEGHEYSIPEYGDDITPYLTSTYAKDALNDISDEDVKEQADDASFLIDENGTISKENQEVIDAGVADGTIDESQVEESQASTGLEYQKDVYEGRTSSEVEIASNGARSDNKVYNAATDSYEYDQTGELKSDEKGKNGWQRWVIDGVTGLAVFGVTKKLTGSSLVGLAAGVGGTALLDSTDILPESFAPVLTAVSGLLPDGEIKDKLNAWATELSGSTIDAQKENLTPENVAAQHQEARLEDTIQAADSVLIQDVSDAMYNNGNVASTSMALWSTASKGEHSASVVNDYVVSKCTGAMEEQWASQIGDGEATEEQKTQMKEYYTKMFDALSSYNDGAQAGISSVFGADSVRGQMSQYGLEMVNRAYTEGVMDSFLRMNEKYAFMDQVELAKLQSGWNIEGIGDLSQYTGSSSFDDLQADAELEVDSLRAMDDLEQETEGSSYVPDYGVSKDSVLADEETQLEPQASEEKEQPTETAEEDVTAKRVAEAEAVLGVSASEGTSAEMELE